MSGDDGNHYKYFVERVHNSGIPVIDLENLFYLSPTERKELYSFGQINDFSVSRGNFSEYGYSVIVREILKQIKS